MGVEVVNMNMNMNMNIRIQLPFCHVLSFLPFPIMLRTPLSSFATRLGRRTKWQAGARSFNATTRRKAEVQLTVDGKQVSIEGTG